MVHPVIGDIPFNDNHAIGNFVQKKKTNDTQMQLMPRNDNEGKDVISMS